ncbi:hypothetical protein GCM10008904_07040 [Paraclostridium ghonii]|uniref:Uncharacterized protein n=1 Tax=Paraclostridium ghonii TaxID=29358 RepID=A0ABU0N2Q3_9FIRM|nr:hypothetical protein [Paeniclostridium ghonii]MDQ0557440.1 hypothetical protein [Paeniclostridium ghonii]
MEAKTKKYNIYKIKKWNIQLVLNFTLLLIFFFMTQVGGVLIGLTYLEGKLALQILSLAICNLIFYKTMRAIRLL